MTHPNPLFRPRDRETMLAEAAAIGFAYFFVATPDGPMVVDAPLTRHGERSFAFHVARANRAAQHLDGARLLASIVGPQGYVSPNWYERPGDQVPTWNYVAIEMEGRAEALDEAGLIAQLDELAAVHEPRVNPAAPWTRAKMADAAFRKMLGAIRGFALEVETVRGTVKLSQNKAAADRAGVIAGLEAGDDSVLARAMQGRG